jgi:hypothetical protein
MPALPSTVSAPYLAPIVSITTLERETDMLRKVALLLTVVAAVTGAFLAGYAVHGSHGTHCPTEDSCGYSYSHHTGTVVPVIP